MKEEEEKRLEKVSNVFMFWLINKGKIFDQSHLEYREGKMREMAHLVNQVEKKKRENCHVR